MNRAPAPAKVNLALVVGPLRDDGKHEVVTVLQRVDIVDRVAVEPSGGRLVVEGFVEDTIVTSALERLAERVGIEARWRVRIDKRIPVAAGLGGGSSDAATALCLANETLDEPRPLEELTSIAAAVGADVPFFLRPGPQLGRGDGTELVTLSLPQDYWIVLLVPDGVAKESTRSVYERFDARGGERGFEERRSTLYDELRLVERANQLARLPRNDLAASPFADRLLELGAFRADVSGAGPAVYGLFTHRRDAETAERRLRSSGRAFLTAPVWYG